METDSLTLLREEVNSCTKCSLHKTRNKPVFGNGNPKAPILMIGEGPGADEDREGVAFVGRSGQLLDKILEACNFTREKHVFISNIVKCRPPQNRNPLPEEQAACLPYLEEQINLIEPKILITLGAVATKAFLGNDAKITRIRGQWHTWQGKLLIPTYHPSALLRNPNLKHDAWEDFKKVILKYREVVDPNHKNQYV
jgi:DNA polymerase